MPDAIIYLLRRYKLIEPQSAALSNYNVKKIKIISSNPLVAYRIDKGLGHGTGRKAHLLLVGYGALNEPSRQDARVPT
jgi:hypothetical protein